MVIAFAYWRVRRGYGNLAAHQMPAAANAMMHRSTGSHDRERPRLFPHRGLLPRATALLHEALKDAELRPLPLR